MADLTYEPTEWADFEQGGTPITAEALNKIENGIANASKAANVLANDRLVTYRVASGGDTATQDVNGDAIVGPCLIFDESITGTYYEPSGDTGDRKLIASADEIKALQGSVSQKVNGNRFTLRWVAPPAENAGVHVIYEDTDFGCIMFRK